tara:strand:- start:2301 stop:2642 length:342 start_codon:yes stop_codon:yes gene_type:complete
MHGLNLKVAAPRVCDKQSAKELTDKIDEVINGKKKEKKLKQSDIFESKKKDKKVKKEVKQPKKDNMEDKLKKHSSTQTKTHMKLMRKNIKAGDTFNIAHRKALIADKNTKKMY